MPSIMKAIALVSGLLVAGCSTASGSETESMATEEMGSGWGTYRASLSLGPGRILFSNGRLASGVGTNKTTAKEPIGIIQTSSRMGERWVVCGVTARGGYFSNGSGTLVCSLVTPDGNMEPIVSLRGLQYYFQYDVSGKAKLIAARGNIIRFDDDGHVVDRWTLEDDRRFFQSLILSQDEVVTMSSNRNDECRLVRYRLFSGGRAELIDRQNLPPTQCIERMLARDSVSDELWLITTGPRLVKLNLDAAFLGLDEGEKIAIRDPRIFTASAGLVIIEGVSTRNNSRLIVYNNLNKELNTIDLMNRTVVGVAPDYHNPEITTFVILYDDYGYYTSLFSNNGAVVYVPPA